MSATAEVVKMPPQSFSIERACEMAMEKGAVDELAKLLDLKLKYQAHESRIAWVNAMRDFKAELPKIEKTKHVSFPNKDGSKTEYDHAELDKVLDLLVPEMKKFGLFPTWKPDSDSSGRVVVACIIHHELGHAEEVGRLSGPADTSGGKNNVQAIGSTVTYLKRYTLFAGLGIEAKGADDDGRRGEGMEENAIEDYCIAMKDSMSLPELQKYFQESWNKAKALNDQSAKARLQKVYEERKRDLFTAKQQEGSNGRG